MLLDLTAEEADVLRHFLAQRLGNLSMEISHTDNPSYRQILRNQRDALRRILDALGPEAAKPGTGTGG